MIGCLDLSIFDMPEESSSFSSGCNSDKGHETMWCCQRVWARHIPRDASAHPPWNQCLKAFGFFNCWDPWSDASPGQQVVQHAMSCETTCTLSTRQTVDPQSINCSTAWADVLAQRLTPNLRPMATLMTSLLLILLWKLISFQIHGLYTQ